MKWKNLFALFVATFLGCMAVLALFGQYAPMDILEVTATKLIVRSDPSRNGKALGTVSRGHRIDILESTGKIETIGGITAPWYKVKTMEGITGYAFSGFMRKPGIVKNLTSTLGIYNACKGKHFDNTHSCAGYVESMMIEKYPGKAARVGDLLTITLSAKGRLTLKNSCNEDCFNTEKVFEKCACYSFVRYYDQGFFLVTVHYFEAGSFLLIDEKSGTKTKLWGAPIFFPDGKKFLAANVDLQAGYTDNGIQIWDASGKTPKKVFEKALTWGALNPVWREDGTISLERYDLNYTSDGLQYSKFTAELEPKGNDWILHE